MVTLDTLDTEDTGDTLNTLDTYKRVFLPILSTMKALTMFPPIWQSPITIVPRFASIDSVTFPWTSNILA